VCGDDIGSPMCHRNNALTSGAPEEPVTITSSVHASSAEVRVTIGPRAARAISGVAARTRLRAADAVYAWVASSRGVPLVTLDREIAQKVGTLCQVRDP
jgi:predicted nucleic acid-binding protein